ncbi:5'-3' exonuclease [Agromyces flavus]|uniref:5'-3' exonuclease n=1 Tax=Agromyces flavus TaxID=589382 RepID=A0A1H1ZXC4_9MICO|nr:5'-3' exonuclease [Agromyces flavus]MCP2367316.1 5'-3' exonuclease [Agromyces flavus]GGI45971.1 5'-3' exonuclease [Agromyces flavus]SDT38217.1 5'-3' exonuclease [Agromyces flavus]
MADRLMLLDTASLYFRAFYGVPDSLKRADGTPVNAVRGLLDMIARLVTDFEPTHLVACWDDDWRPHWRVELIPSYKAHRVEEVVPGGPDVEEVPDPLEAQVPMIRETLGLLGIPVVGVAAHEADDVIGTLATDAGMPVDVVTGDRDLFQLVDDAAGVRVIYTARGMSKLEIVTDAWVLAKYDIAPSQYADFATLRGDTSDGLPGVAGIGEKTAAGLLREFGTLDAMLAVASGEAGVEVPPRMSATMRAKLGAARDYLAVAPTVVNVVRTLDVPGAEELGARLAPVDGDARATIEALAEEWNLGGSVPRVLAALDRTGAA